MKSKSIKEHEREYIHISKPELLVLFLILILGLLNWFWFKVVQSSYYFFEINIILESSESVVVGLYHYAFFSVVLIEYILLCLFVISIIALLRGGFNKLKSFEEKGLLFGLFGGLFGGLFFFLVVGLFGGLFVDLFGGLLFGLVFGLVIGLVFGLFDGLSEELEK